MDAFNPRAYTCPVNYGATFFAGPDCSGDIGGGPIVNFGCSDHCFPANAAMSVMLEGNFYDRYANNGGDKEEGNYYKELFKFVYNRVDSDGPVAYPYSTGDCNGTYDMGRVAIRWHRDAVCATFERPAYSFRLHFQRMCTPDDRIRKVGRPSPPSEMTRIKDWAKEQRAVGFQAWTGDSLPAADGPPPDEPLPDEQPLPDEPLPQDTEQGVGDKCKGRRRPRKGCGPRIKKGWQGDWAKTAEGWQHMKEGDFRNAKFDWYKEPEVLPGGQTLRDWNEEAEAAFHSWRGGEEDKSKNRKPRPKLWVYGEPKNKPFYYGSAKPKEEKKRPKNQGVIWGEDREQVGYWEEGQWSAPEGAET